MAKYFLGGRIIWRSGDGRIEPDSFTMDPGMRARDEFSDITSRGYNERAKRVAERGGAMEYATSGEEEAAARHGADVRTRVGYALAALASRGLAQRGIGRQRAGRNRWHVDRSTDVGTGVGAVGTAAWPELHRRGWTPRELIQSYIRDLSDTVERTW